MSSSTSHLSLENHNQLVRQLYLDASLLEQTIQQHVETHRVGCRSSTSSHPSSPASERRLNLSDTSVTSHQHRRQISTASPNSNNRRSSRQQQQGPQDEQGFQLPTPEQFRTSDEELIFLRDSLKDVFEVLLLEDLIAAAEKSIDERLWRNVFYTHIEELRAELRKLDKNNPRRQEVTDSLLKLLDKGTGFYHEMITALSCEHQLDLTTVAVDLLQSESGINKSKTTLQDSKSVQHRGRHGQGRQQSRIKEELPATTYPKESLANCIQKCFMYLGDLARYRTNILLESNSASAAAQAFGLGKSRPQGKPSASDWHMAHMYYQRAIRTFPDSGKPYGQIAILASYANDDLGALYWYSQSLAARCPSTVVRDNLKVFFSRYQNRFKDLLSSIYPTAEGLNDTTSADEDMDTSPENHPMSVKRLALNRMELDMLFIKIQMDLFEPHLQSSTFCDPGILEAICHKLSSKVEGRGYEGTVHKMIASLVFVVHDLFARSSIAPLTVTSATKEGALGLKKAQRTGLIYLLAMTTVLLNHQLKCLNSTSPEDSGTFSRLRQDLISPTLYLIEFWISHWDQVWGTIRLEEKWSVGSDSADFSLKKTTVAFFRSFVNVLNIVRSPDQAALSPEDISYKALFLLQQDRSSFFGLLPFRRFHIQLATCFDVVENPEETRYYRLLLFAEKVIQASEGIRGTVMELTIEPVSDNNTNGATYYRLLDTDDKRLLRERGFKVLASHWLQDQVSSLQKGLENTERRSGQNNRQAAPQNRKDNTRTRGLVPISTLPGTVKLPLSGQTRLTDHYQRGGPRSAMSGMSRSSRSNTEHNAAVSRGFPDKNDPPRWTCVVDFSVLVWHLAGVKALLDHRQCLIIVPLDVIDRLDQAKKGQDKENQKTREAIRFLDDRLNMVRWGMTEPLLVGQNVKDSLGRWSEAIPFLIQEDEVMKDPTDQGNVQMDIGQDGDVVMTDVDAGKDAEGGHGAGSKDLDKKSNAAAGETEEQLNDDIEDDDEEEVEVRNAMNVPRIWRPILGACLFMLRKRDEAHRIPEDRFVLLTEDQDLAYYAGWFNIPTHSILTWKHNGI
ncbi:Protein smg7 [Mortierella polycephala]|uniref:Protein smg7 n=1 Tax=Mortierella polycephala TaxID=41804 RepID=A0A9P6QCC1_9FUNG|nr:Protein smg7 [Mortierella polycephala]